MNTYAEARHDPATDSLRISVYIDGHLACRDNIICNASAATGAAGFHLALLGWPVTAEWRRNGDRWIALVTRRPDASRVIVDEPGPAPRASQRVA